VVGGAAASLFFGGIGPWLDYAAVAGTAARADFVVRNNIGPAALVAGLFGVGEEGARILQGLVVAIAGASAVAAAWRVPDRVASLAIAATGSLVVLPVTWFHYPAPLIPFATVAVLRARGTTRESRTNLLVAGAV